MENDLIYAGLAAVLGGFVNAVAGGGTLITFPVLTALGIPPVAANVTNTVALCPGYFGGTVAQLSDLKTTGKNIWLLLLIGFLGGLTGGLILITTNEKIFTFLIPYLIMFGALLLAFQPYIKKIFLYKNYTDKTYYNKILSIILIIPAALYGGYFGAGLGVILLAVLGLYIEQPLTKINALKQAISLCVNIAAAILFIFSGYVYWYYALIMAICAIIGGICGGLVIKKINTEIFRWIVVAVGIIISIYYFIK